MTGGGGGVKKTSAAAARWRRRTVLVSPGQTMNHIVDMCPLTKFEGGLNLLHEADDDADIWPESTATAAVAN